MPYSFLKKYKPQLLLILFVWVAYLPLASFLFSLKNDAFLYNFPNKYFFSEALHHGHIPFWNPYLNYGFPLFADPGFSWWHPLTWVFGFIGYTPFTLTIELLVYLTIAAIGMYWLGRQLLLDKRTAFLMGALFVGSGFFIGNMQHINFLTCAAYIPWLTGCWLRLQRLPSLKNLIAAVASAYLLFTAGHPAIPIAMSYFLMMTALVYFFVHRRRVKFSSVFGWNVAFLFTTFLFCLPALLSYKQLMPLYTRSAVVDQVASNNVGFTVSSYLSFFSPVPTIKNSSFFATDISMRNGYFSLFGFLAFINVTLGKKNKTQLIFLTAGIFMLMLSMGGWVKELLYKALPLLTFIRTNGEFRVFALFSFIVCIGYLLQDVLSGINEAATLKRLLKFSIAIFCIGAVASIVFILTTFHTDPEAAQLKETGVKAWLDHITFSQAILAGCLLGLGFSLTYLFVLKKKRLRLLPCVILADVVFHCWLLLPVTGVSQKSDAYLAALINQAPKGFPTPALAYNDADAKPVTAADEARVGNWWWYDKQIVHGQIDYPSGLRSTEAFYSRPDTAFSHKPFIFLKHQNGTINILKFEPASIHVTVHLLVTDTLSLLQNNYPGWVINVNKKQVLPLLSHNPFLSVPLPPGLQEVQFTFKPRVW